MHYQSILLGLATCASVAFAVPATQPRQQWAVYTNKTMFRDIILRETNAWRYQFQVPDVTWDETLAADAKELSDTCIFEHRKGHQYGESLSVNHASPADSILDWGEEYSVYDYNSPGFGLAVGHFTQQVWKNTKKIGCAATFCEDVQNSPGKDDDGNDIAWGWYLVCSYDPPGNYPGQFPDNVLPPRTKA